MAEPEHPPADPAPQRPPDADVPPIDLFDNPVVGVRVASVAEGGRFVRANRRFQRMMGYSEEELRQRTFFDITHPDDVELNRRLFDEVASGARDSFQIEKRYRRKDGSTFWGRLTVYRDGAPPGPPRYLIGLVEDVSEHKAVEQARLEAVERLEALLVAAVDAIITIDPAGIIQSVNPATERLFGYAPGELAGQNVKVLMPSPYREEHDGYVARYRRTGQKRIIGIGREVEGQRKDGTVFPVDLAVSEVRIGEERLFMGTIRDLSERKLLEQSFLQSQKMEAVGRLAGGVAHDFNTLLGTITGYAEMLQNAVADREAPVRRYADRILQAARRGADLTRQLLTFSRRQEVRPRRIDVSALTAETADMIRRLIGEDIAFEHRVEEGLAVAIDPGQLQQVLLNLAVNAADAMPRGGRLAIEWRRVELGRETPAEGGALAAGRYAVLVVEDTGIGMDEATRQRIFEPFFTTKETGKGTGLGLSTVFGIVRQWEGGITVATAPGAGTTFRVFLPEVEAEAPAADAAPAAETAPPAAVAAAETVLLVEDDAMFRGLVHEVLEAAGYEVLEAGDPAQALAICDGRPSGVDVLVSDLVMPGGNGADLAVALRRRYPGLKVVLMSGYSGDALVSRDLDESLADSFLEKPFPIDELLRHIRRILGR